MNENKCIVLIYIILFFGIAGHFIGSLFNLMLWITPIVLLILGLFVIFSSKKYLSKNFIYWFILAYSFTLTIEITGVWTGIIFGKYSYGDVLGYKLFGVPLIIGFNWMLVILGAVNISSKLSSNFYYISLICGMLGVMFDFILEPVAVKFGYWQWSNNIIPLQNYLAWFLVSFLISFSIRYFKINIYSKVFIHYFTGLILFFLILNFK
ncbi:MAG: carotenoid biosynthesis protein [bacterium]